MNQHRGVACIHRESSRFYEKKVVKKLVLSIMNSVTNESGKHLMFYKLAFTEKAFSCCHVHPIYAWYMENKLIPFSTRALPGNVETWKHGNDCQ